MYDKIKLISVVVQGLNIGKYILFKFYLKKYKIVFVKMAKLVLIKPTND